MTSLKDRLNHAARPLSLKERLGAATSKEAAKDPYQFPKTWGTRDRKTKKVKPFYGNAAKQVDLWRTWKESGEDPDKLQPLLSSLEPTIQTNVLRHKAPRIHRPVIEAEARTMAVKALRRYDPAKGSMPSTHVHNNLKGLNRFVKKHQNFTRIVEAQANRIGDYARAKEALAEELGREPTTLELSDRLKMSVAKVTRLEQENRKDSFSALQTDTTFESNPFEKELPVHREIIQMLPYELTLDEQKVFNYLFGQGGKRKDTSTSSIARKLKWSDSKVSQTKNSIIRKYQDYMDSF